MSQLTRPRFDLSVPPDNVGELVYRLGGIDPARIVWHPTPGTATVDDLIAAAEKPACELVAGTVIRIPGGFRDAVLCSYLSGRLVRWVCDRNLGTVTGLKAPFLFPPDTVRLCDIAFTPWYRLPGRRIPTEPVPAVAPALVVDFHRSGHTTAELVRKRADLFRAGVDLYWEIIRAKRVAVVHTPDERSRVLTARDALDGGDVLPGFAVRLADLFAELDRHG